MGKLKLHLFILYEIFDDPELNGSDIMVYAALMRHMNYVRATSYPSIRTICKDARLSKETVIKSLRKLEKRGYIRIIQERGKKNTYVLLDPESGAKIAADMSGLKIDTGRELGKGVVGKEGTVPVRNEGTELYVLEQEDINKKHAPPSSPIGSDTPQGGRLSSAEKISQHGEKVNKPPLVEQAEMIYQAYPRKVGHKAAVKSIVKALKEVPYETLLKKVKQYASSANGGDKRFIPHPTTWFNQGRWEDDPAEWSKTYGGDRL